ncbi:MAG: hypothetical protein HYR56_30610 [Acidobacteria bacterium]|nr:hypothetical protein [Acidobacteriota bacterium]MBI3427879.1 hypothetical protein [Acidobacteriota bacterium]
MFRANLLCRPRLCLQVVLCSLLLTGLSVNTHATIMRYLEVEELARLSTDVIHGQVLSTRTYWDEGHARIYTAVRVQVDEALKGTTKRGGIVTITQLGGELDGMRLDYSGRPKFSSGEAVVLFTKTGRKQDFIVVGMQQGKLRVVGDEVVRDFSGITLLEETPPNTSGLAGRIIAPSKPQRIQTRMSLSELRQRLAKL